MEDFRKGLGISSEQAWLATISLMILASVAMAIVLSYTREVTLSFVLAVFIASIVSPVVDFQVIRWKVPHALAVFSAVMLTIVVVVLFVMLLSWSATTLSGVKEKYSDAIDDKIVTPFNNIMNDFLQPKPNEDDETKLNEDDNTKPKENDENQMKKMGDSEKPWFEELRGFLPSLASSVLNKTLSVLSFTFFVLIFVMFILAGRDPYVIKEGIYAEIDKKIRNYIMTKLTVSFVTGLLVWVTLYWIGLDYAEVFAVLAFLLNFIPSIGSVISTLLPIPLALLQFQNPWLIAAVVLIPGTIQMAIGNFVEPKLMGEGMKLHPIAIVMALAFWGFIWGPVGTLLAVPMTAVLRIILLRFETVRPVGELLGGKLPQPKGETSVA